MNKLWYEIKKWIVGCCPKCGTIGTFKRRNDTGLLLHFNRSWMECRYCGYIEGD